MKIAFFDFDGTLTKHDSFVEFAKFSCGKATFYKAFIKSIPDMCLWKLGIISNSTAKQHLFSRLYKGMDYAEFKVICESFIQQINIDQRNDIIRLVEQHQQNGVKVIIVSASISDWIKPWANQHGINDVIATEVEVNEYGLITGQFSTKNCHGQEKAIRIKQLFPDLHNYETWGYGDSPGDNQMLAIVTHPNRV